MDDRFFYTDTQRNHYLRILLTVLLKYNGYLQYLKNINIVQNTSDSLNYPLGIDEGLINYGFTWARTNEGHDFWRFLNDKYYAECPKNSYVRRPNKKLL